MIPKRDTTLVDSTVSGTAVAMSIDTSALAHIMNVLTDLYADPELAIIREYSTNALDAHVDAGIKRPIEVSTPTALRPVFSVRDFGPGLTKDDIEQIYSRYGASTKRATNDAVGMLGLGCKSALAYVDQFTLVGIVNGDRVSVSVARDENGAGTMTVLEAGPTDEPDGVEISIPAKRENELEAKAAKFFAHWAPGTVLLNGSEPDPIEGYHVGDDFTVIERAQPSYRWDRGARGNGATPILQVVMGNVAYPAPADYKHPVLEALPGGKSLVARVPIGTVAFVPSREGLQDAAATRKALDATLELFDEQLQAKIAAEIANAASKPAAAAALLELRASLGEGMVKGQTWKGQPIPVEAGFKKLPTPEGAEQKYEHKIWHAYPHGSTYRHMSDRMLCSGGVRLALALSGVWVLNYDNDTWASSQRRKLDAYLDAEGISTTGGSHEDVLLTTADAVPNAEWLDGAARVVDWQVIRKWKNPATAAASGAGRSYAGTYMTVSADGWIKETPASDLESLASGRLFYLEGTMWEPYATDLRELLGDKAVIACMPSTRIQKFKRLFPKAKQATDAAREKSKRWLDGLTETQRAALATWRHSGSAARVQLEFFASLDGSRLDDPALGDFVSMAEALTPQLREAYNRFGVHISVPASERRTPPKGYALLDHMNLRIASHGATLDHVTLYLNAAYAARPKGSK